MTTLFSQRLDLSDAHAGVCLYNRSYNRDTYTVGFSGVSIYHSAKRGPAEVVEGESISGGTLYIAGEAYDVFSVWAQVQTADSTIGRPGMSKCIAEDCLTFDDAVAAAIAHLN